MLRGTKILPVVGIGELYFVPVQNLGQSDTELKDKLATIKCRRITLP